MLGPVFMAQKVATCLNVKNITIVQWWAVGQLDLRSAHYWTIPTAFKFDKLQPFEPWRQALAFVLGCNLSTRNESRIRDYKYKAIK